MCWFIKKTVERPSPKIRITPEMADKVIRAIQFIPGYDLCYVAAVAPTNSMEPVIDDGMYVIIQLVNYHDLIVGDIIWYEHPEFKAIHRIIKILNDGSWYCICKGDNNSSKDPVRVRPEHIRGVWRMTLD